MFICHRFLENVKNYRDIRIITSKHFAEKHAIKSKVNSYTILDDGLVCIDNIKEEVKLNKPIFAGMVCN